MTAEQSFSTPRDIIDLWPSGPALARGLSLKKTSAVRNWRDRNAIPEVHWMAIVRLAAECGFDGVTYALLTEIHRRKGRPEERDDG